MSGVARRGVLGLAVVTALAGCSASSDGHPARRSAGPATPSASPTPSPASPTPAVAPTGPAVEVARAEDVGPRVALTFHGAGSLEITREVLALLARRQAAVTVMAVGTWLERAPDGIRMVRDAGHEIGNHTWSHPDLSRMEPQPVRTEIERCRDRLDTLVGTPGRFFRQSDAQHATREELREAGRAGYRRVLSYDVDSLDWRDPGTETIRRAVRSARAGSVVSMHLGHHGTLLALPGVLDDLAARGLHPVTAGELFGGASAPPRA